MNIKIQRIANLLIGIFFIIFGSYFIYLCIINIRGMGWYIIYPEDNISALRHHTGEDFSQLILLAICGLGGIICGASHLWYLYINIDNKQ